MAVTEQTLRLIAGLRARLTATTNEQARTMTAAWARAWDEVATDLDAALGDLAASVGDGGRITQAQVLRSARLTNALRVIGDQLEAVAADAGITITADLPGVVDDAGRVQARVVTSQLPARTDLTVVGWDRVDAEQITAIVTRSTEQITSLLRPLSDDATRVMRRELVRGMAAGSNPRQTADRMLQRTEGRFNGGLSRALTIARTETLDAHRRAAQVSQQANADVLAGWVWTAQLDSRTCPACWSQHGQVHPLDVAGPIGHQNCRCARTPKTKSWRDLGIDLDEPADLLPSAADRFDALDPAEQRTILGPKRYDAWADGDYPMDTWSVTRSTPGWRDSVHTSPAPQSGGRRGSSAALAS